MIRSRLTSTSKWITFTGGAQQHCDGLRRWDWRANRRLDLFPVALGVLLLYDVGTLTLHRVPLWNAFCEWFLGLPLS